MRPPRHLAAALALVLALALPRPAFPAAGGSSPPAAGPGAIEALWTRGEAALRAGDADAAVRHFGEALALDERRARSWNYLGGAHFARGELARARGEFARAVELDPADARAANNLGTVLERLGELAAAERSFLGAAAADPSYAVPHRNLGVLYARRLGRPEDARHAWTRFLELAPAGADADEVRRELAALPPPGPAR